MAREFDSAAWLACMSGACDCVRVEVGGRRLALVEVGGQLGGRLGIVS